jgi:hypothetical protein
MTRPKPPVTNKPKTESGSNKLQAQNDNSKPKSA